METPRFGPSSSAALALNAAGVIETVTIAICAFNEVQNIRTLLEHLRELHGSYVGEVLVVSSGSTDGTDDVVRELSEQTGGWIRLVVEEERHGKVSAVNIVLQESKFDNVILVDADNLPTYECLHLVAAALSDPTVGGVGTHNVPVNATESLAARIAACMWRAHHLVNLQQAVLGGDVCGLKRVVEEIPTSAVNDDWVLENEIQTQGLRIVYIPEALTYMRVPTTLRDYIRQRRRIYAGYLDEFVSYHYVKATLRPQNLAKAFLQLVLSDPIQLPFSILLCGVELYAMALAWGDRRFGRQDHRVWQTVESSKGDMRALRD
jgi:cellulose synthase/poly-beta-1,6-N-acetylglucosamine synthase-like glycosyltransferase